MHREDRYGQRRKRGDAIPGGGPALAAKPACHRSSPPGEVRSADTRRMLLAESTAHQAPAQHRRTEPKAAGKARPGG
jgi:hypothetical protein